MLFDLIRLSRPKHWIKNVFSLLPVPFALAGGARLDIPVFTAGLMSFCLASSSIYAVNDARDVERDRLHETKQHRPIAAGRISVPVAYAWSVFLALSGAGLAVVTGRSRVVVLYATYIAINLIYSLGLKHVSLLDVFLLSVMYMQRALLGCALLDAPASNWLLLCAGSLALFISLAKRRADIVAGMDGSHRPALEGYNAAFLDQGTAISAVMTVVAYAMYVIDAATKESVLIPGRELASLPFVLFGVLHYLRVAHVHRGGGSPVDMLLKSPTMLITGVAWLGVTVWSVRL